MNKELNAIQTTLKAPKGQYNSFGKYKYRSCEDILEAVKPLLAEQKATVTLSDEMVLIGDRYYIKATATFSSESGEVSNTAYAREADAKKGMDAAQVTGSTSSYARKYALNGLFCIDDTKDADYTNNGQNQQQRPPQQQNRRPTQMQNNQTDAYTTLVDYGKACGYSIDQMKQITSDKFKKISLKDLTDEERHKLCVHMKKNQRGKTA